MRRKTRIFKIKAGFIDGEILDVEGVKALAEIPSKEGLLVKMMGSMQSSLYGLLTYCRRRSTKKQQAQKRNLQSYYRRK